MDVVGLGPIEEDESQESEHECHGREEERDFLAETGLDQHVKRHHRAEDGDGGEHEEDEHHLHRVPRDTGHVMDEGVGTLPSDGAIYQNPEQKYICAAKNCVGQDRK